MRVSLAASNNRQRLDGVTARAMHAAFALVAWLLLASSAHAQVCADALEGTADSDTPSAERFTMQCDMTYKNAEIACDKRTAFASCAAKPMPIKDTVLKSFIKDYSPFLYTFARDPEDKDRPYSGEYALGAPGDQQHTFQMTGKSSKNTKRISECKSQITFPGKASSPEEEAKMVRMEVDNCTNQYILYSSLDPYQKENTTLLSMEDPADPSKRISLATHCQPLNTVNDIKNEYFVSDYLKAAWIKMLQDPTYRKTPGAKLEPHLPSGITLKNPIAPPSPFPDVRVSSIGAVKYEEINDPTHPFSPRWDFKNNERDEFSPKTGIYQDPTKNAVYCAGVKEADDSEQGKTKSDQEVKVDILEFRRPAFQKGMDNRIGFNSACFADPTNFTGPLPAVIAGSYCYVIIVPPNPANPVGVGQALPCWKCFGHPPGQKVDDINTLPPCTTRYDGQDQRIVSPFLPGLRNGMNRKAACSLDGKRKAAYDITTLCRDLRAPYASINKLKMRYHNPKEKDKIVLKEGVQEGFTFKEYFDNHMPYPRLWDTGNSIQKNMSGGGSSQQDPKDVYGQYTAIVGVGHEASAGNTATAPSGGASGGAGGAADDQQAFDALKKQDLRCLFGGWGGNQSFGGVSIKLPDPVTSWTEMKLYQTRTLRDLNLSCVGRYEKVFKPGSTENQILLKIGAEWARGIVSTPTGTRNRYTHQSLAEKTEAGAPAAGAGDEKPREIMQIKPEAYPLGWRGYFTAKNASTRFPNFGGSGGGMTGLDNVELGDILLLETGGAKSGDKPGLPRLAVVSSTNVPKSSDCAKRSPKNCSIRIMEYDNGKWPDVCGTTDTWGDRKERTLYKKGMLPSSAKAEYDRVKTSSSCSNTSISICEMDGWDQVKFYRIRNDVRQGRPRTTTGATP